MLRVLKNPLEVIPDWNTLQHNEIAYTNAQLTTANSEINRNGEYSSKLYFINVNNHIRNVIFTIYKDEIDLDGNIINGRVFFNNLEGIFIDGYIIEKGEFTKRYVLTKEIQKASFFPFFLLQDTSETSETYCWPTESNLPGFEMTFTTNNLTTTGPDESGGNETGHSDSYNWYYANGYGGMDYGTYINNATQGLPTGGGSSSLSTGQITSAAAAILMASPVDPDEEGKCPEGYKKNPTTGKCDPICIGGKVYDSTTKECNCPDGKVEDKNGNCVDKPCEGDLVQNPEIAPQTNSGIQGGIYGTCTRYGRNCPGNPNVRMHNGIDIKNPKVAPIFAIYGGSATYHTQRDIKTNKIKGAGHYVAVVSNVNGQTVRMVYFHLQENNRASGTIRAGDIIGYQDESGNLKNAIDQGLTVSHVHIKTQENGSSANPLNHFNTQIDPNTGQEISPCN